MRIATVASTLLIATASHLHAASFRVIPADTLGGMQTSADAVSGDGFFIVGTARNGNGNDLAYRRSVFDIPSLAEIGDLPGSVDLSSAQAASETGSIVVGRGLSNNGLEAFVWHEDGVIQPLGDLAGGGFSSKANGLSADGSVIIGEGLSTNTEAFVWTESTGMHGLGFLAGGTASGANAVSPDGSVVVGFSTGPSGIEAASWTNLGPAVGLDTPGSATATITARDLSADGSVIVGEGIRLGLGAEAFRWTAANGVEGLGDLGGGAFESEARATSADGSIVVGRGKTIFGDAAFIWDNANGMREIADVLSQDFSVDIGLHTLEIATGISDAGTVIVGNGTDSNNKPIGWTAYLGHYWTGIVNQDWNLSLNWLSFDAPGGAPVQDVILKPALGSTINGPNTSTNVLDLFIGARVEGRTVLRLNQGNINALGGVIIETSGGLSGQGSLTAHLGIENHGEIALDPGGQLQGGRLTNHALIIAGGEIFNRLTNAADAEVRASSNQTIRFHGSGNISEGQINLFGGSIEFTQELTNTESARIAGRGTVIVAGGLLNAGQILLSGGFSDIQGPVTMTGGVGSIVVSSNGVTTFFSEVVHNGEFIRASGDSTITFLADVSGAGNFTGTGNLNFEAGYYPGNSPGLIHFAGDLNFGDDSILQLELAGTTPGTLHDHLSIAGTLQAAGTLTVTLLNSYTPQPGDTFDLFDFTTLSGSFQQVDLPALPHGLTFDATNLFTSGTLTVVPEPGVLAGFILLPLALTQRPRSPTPYSDHPHRC